MNPPIICSDVRSETQNDQTRLVVIASQDECENGRSFDVADLSQVSGIKAKLVSQGIVLGGPLLRANPPVQENQPSPLEICAKDGHGRKHLFFVDHSEVYSLSSGSTLYYFYVPDSPGDYHWLVGQTLEIRDAQKQLEPHHSSNQQNH